MKNFPIYTYGNRSLNHLFDITEYSTKAAYKKNREAYVDSLNLVLLSIQRTGKKGRQEYPIVFPHFCTIVENVAVDPTTGYKIWINKTIEGKIPSEFNVNICPNDTENNLNEYETLLLLLLFQNYSENKKWYKTNATALLETEEENADSIVAIARSEKTKSNQFNSLARTYGLAYLNCYFSLQLLFLCAGSNEFHEILTDGIQEEYDNEFKKYSKSNIGLKKEILKADFNKDPLYSAIYKFDIYRPFVEAIKQFDGEKLQPINTYLTYEMVDFHENYTIMSNRKLKGDKTWFLLELLRKGDWSLDNQHTLCKKEIEPYSLFTLFDSVLSEAFFPGITYICNEFSNTEHTYHDSFNLLFNNLTVGYGRLSLLLVAKDNKKNDGDYWF